MFQDLSVRARQDEEEASKLRKERDDLLQQDAETRQQALDLLATVEMEQELKLGVEERSMALQQRASLDAKAIARLRKERDELHQTAKRLSSERGMAREERDQAIREHDEARQGVSSLWVDPGAAMARRLEAESVSIGLGTELAEVRGILQAKSDEHDLLRAAVGVVFDDLG